MNDHTPSSSALKVCTWCGKAKPFSDYYQYKTGRKKGTYFPHCCECGNADRMARRRGERKSMPRQPLSLPPKNPDAFYPSDLENYAFWVSVHGLVAPYGECQCGCGEKTNIARETERKRGWSRDKPVRFIPGHTRNSQRKPIRAQKDEIPDGAHVVPLTKGRIAIVDIEDRELVGQWKWYFNSNGYAARSVQKKGERVQIYLHRFLTGASLEQQVDHINGNKLDNRRSNLRLCTASENSFNSKKTTSPTSSRFKGVYLNRNLNKWAAQIKKEQTVRSLGLYATEEEAARVYDKHALLEFGEFAKLNFPLGDEQ